MLAVLLFAATATPTLADDPTDRVMLDGFLARPFEVFDHDRTPRGFRIIALSNLAEYCGRRGHATCLRRTVDIALDARLSPYGRQGLDKANLGDHGLYLAHLTVILTEVRQRLEDPRFDRILHRIASHLAQQTEAAPNHHIASYAGRKERYPADQAVVLFALFRYDRLFGKKTCESLVRTWLEYMATKGASANGLHRSEVTGTAPWGQDARGCAMSWTIRYMAAFAPAAARDLWARYAQRYEVDALWFAGFREWPPGVKRPADHDSGPIVMGIGVAATAFAIGASRAVGDTSRHNKLRRTMSAVYQAGGEAAQREGRTVLARAIALNAITGAR